MLRQNLLKKLLRILVLLVLVFIDGKANSQQLKIKNYSLGYRVFEVEGEGNNPLTIAPLLKNPIAYQNFINNLSYTGLSGNPAIQTLRNFYLNAELYKKSSSRFWERYTIQTGLLISNKLVKHGLAIDEQKLVYLPADTTVNTNVYSLTQQQQFLGAMLGINRRFRISDKLYFITGVHLHGSLAILHTYLPQWDSTVNSCQYGLMTKTTRLPAINGRNFFQWQAMLPLGLELAIYKQQLFIRAEIAAGIISSLKRISSNIREAHGAGIWLIYQPK